MKELFSYLARGQRGRLSLTLVFVILSGILDIALAYVMMKCVDLAMGGTLTKAWSVAIWLVVYMILYFTVDYLSKRLKWRTIQHAQNHLRNDLATYIWNMPYRAFHEKNTGAWLATLTSQCSMIEESYFKIFFSFFSDILTFAISLVLLTFISPWLTLFVLGTTGLQMLIPRIMGPKLAERKATEMKEAEAFSTTATEHLNGFDLVKSFNLNKYSLSSLQEAGAKLEKAKFSSRVFSSLTRLFSFSFGQVIYVGIFFLGAMLIISGKMTVGMMIMASQLVVYIASPLETMSEDLTEMKSAGEMFAGLKEELHPAVPAASQGDAVGQGDAPSPAPQPVQALQRPVQKIEARNLSFSYDDHQVLDGVDARLVQGKKYLLVGPSGSGKSTLAKLITGMYPLQEGSIFFNGLDIQTIDPEDLARAVLACSQSTFIFEASLRDNITLFHPSFTDEEVREVIKKVDLEYLLDRYPDGLNHRMGQAGQTLSGGEKQKIALARIELYQPDVVILDETFANLDPPTALKLTQMAVGENHRTVIVITHHLSDEMYTLFDELWEMRQGKLLVKEI